ncbi:peptidoglycan D,D-transpeptidase FtsI family protein [Sphingomicrobium astaxanthinifaciens]|uniref:peptidoglycan D,D-transpeptidase FtsI family protein n=1 Tax=Sphingomicrobium astaxanthinifaciens TaxID=1227949 RepID=UPI001FCC26FA|nr:penicillin-binding protein 2 [Sphingomicrobium astaxanthinifaciens]MCJ7421633.1 penicillin-binding protein 2 [Sphingomicrobium astaxanthinifaciens]
MSRGPGPALVSAPERLKLQGQKRQLLSMMHQRLMVAMLLFAFGILTVSGRIGYLAIFGADAATTAGGAAHAATRGDIVDRDGQPLARTIEAWTVAVQPHKVIGNKLDLARELARLMPEKDEADYYALLTSGKTFAYLQRRAGPRLVEAVNALGEPGIQLTREPDRLYPQTALAAHVIGYTDIDGKGVAGAEAAFDEALSDPRGGDPVQLSIAAPVQGALRAELAAAMTQFDAIGAAGVIMDVHTSEIIALASLPQLNPNVAGQGGAEARFNRAALGVYELGSTFKPFTVAMGLEEGKVTSMGQMYDCPESYEVGGRRISDTHPFGRACSVAEIMMESSNVGTAQIAQAIGGARQKAYLDKMGFTRRLDYELPERGRPLTPREWSEIATVTVGYGHGIAVTPVHLASGYATLFNGGLYRPPTVLKVGPDHPVARGERVFSEQTSEAMRALLRLVVTHGTGKKADAPGYRVGGKTGTAEKIVGGRYSKRIVVTSFAGVFPIDEPRYVIVVMLDEPKGTKETFGFRTAGWNVAPLVSKTVARVAPMLGVRPDTAREPDMGQVLPFVRLDEE